MPTSKNRTLLSLPVLAALVLMVLALALVPVAQAQEPFTLTILHTNDTHAHLESFQPVNEPLQGGVARRYTAIQQVRAEGGNVLLVDAGDAFQGTLFFNQWKGEEESHFMNALGYQAMALGNHEFDLGSAPLAKFIQEANFPVVSANIDVSTDDDLAGLVYAYTSLEVGGEKIGIFGLTTPDTVKISSPGPNVDFAYEPAEAAAAMVEFLHQDGVDKIVALTHLGYDRDQALAAAVNGIDVIVGGHSHTPVGDMPGSQGPYPTVVTTPNGGTTLVVTAWDWGRYLGRLDVTFDGDGQVQSYDGQPIFMDESIAEDPGIAADVATYAQPLQKLQETPVGQAAVDLQGDRPLVRSQETNLADLICDAVLWKTAAQDTQICIQNGGAIRDSIPAGQVNMGQVLTVLPFGNQIATFGLKGSDLRTALESGLSVYDEVGGAFPQVGGIKYVFDPSQPAGSRVVGVEVKDAGGGYSPLDPDTVYQVASNDYLRGGGDGYDVFANNAINPYDGGALLADAVADYIGVHSPVNPATDGRITQGTAAPALPETGGEPAGAWPVYVILAGVTLMVVGISVRQRDWDQAS